jgi:hypothetical protein
MKTAPRADRRAARRLARARQLDAEIRHWHQQGLAAEAQVMIRVEQMEADRLWEPLLYSSINAYTRELAGWSASKTSKVITVARASHLPLLQVAFRSGELGWTTCYLIANVATQEDEAEWLELARSGSRNDVEEEIARRANREVIRPRVFRLPPEHLAEIEQGIAEVLKDSPELSREDALATLVHWGRTGGGTNGCKSQTVIYVCRDCDKTVRQSPAGLVEVTPAAREQLACDTKLLDITKGPAPQTRSIPTRTRDYVEARDMGRCRVPGCTKTTNLEIHHEGGWKIVGHDPEACYSTCWAHHAARHAGAFRVVTLMKGVYRFESVDGMTHFGDLDIRLPEGFPGERGASR